MSKSFYVRLPIGGVIGAYVTAENKDEAIEKAMGLEWSTDFKGKDVELEEVDVYQKVVDGNICYLPLWKASAEETDEE